ncbi:Fc.00g059090.m01.CDS01 [Cosmosporella sp. VM-42]
MSNRHPNSQRDVSPPYSAGAFGHDSHIWYQDSAGNRGASLARRPFHQASHSASDGRSLINAGSVGDASLDSSRASTAGALRSDRASRDEDNRAQQNMLNGSARRQSSLNVNPSYLPVAEPSGGYSRAQDSVPVSVAANPGSWPSSAEGNIPPENDNSPYSSRWAATDEANRTRVVVQPFIREQALSGATTRNPSEGERSMRVVDNQFPHLQRTQREGQFHFGGYSTTLDFSSNEKQN